MPTLITLPPEQERRIRAAATIGQLRLAIRGVIQQSPTVGQMTIYALDDVVERALLIAIAARNCAIERQRALFKR